MAAPARATREAADRLLAEDRAYPCYCTPEELDADRRAQEAAKLAAALRRPLRGADRRTSAPPARPRAGRAALRFRVGPGVVAFDDIVRGHVEIDVARPRRRPRHRPRRRHAALPLHGRRRRRRDGDQPRHPRRGPPVATRRSTSCSSARSAIPSRVFAHLPLILNPDRTKMSKRKSQTAVERLHRRGLHPRGASSTTSRCLGWSPGTEEEVLSLDEIVERFDLAGVQKGGAVFDRERLEWLNGQWIRRLADDDLVDRLAPVPRGRAGRRPDRPRPRPTRSSRRSCRSSGSACPTLGAIGDLVGFLFVDAIDARPGAPRAEALGARRPPARALAAASRAIDRRRRRR